SPLDVNTFCQYVLWRSLRGGGTPAGYSLKQPRCARPVRRRTREVRTRSAAPSNPDRMNAILIKLFATALTLSQVTTRPDAVRTAFEPGDKGEVVRILRDGCAHMRKAFDIEDLNL